MKMFVCYKCGQPIYARTLEDVHPVSGQADNVECTECHKEHRDNEE